MSGKRAVLLVFSVALFSGVRAWSGDLGIRDITYEFSGGDEAWLSVSPPQPFNWNRAH